MSYKIVKYGKKRERRNYSKIRNTYELKDLLEVQKKSYDWFITTGIKEVFEDLFPVENFSGTLSLEFGDYHFDEPRYSIKASKDRETTYAAPLKVEVRLFNRETGEVKEQEIFLGDMPIMTDSATFIINGAERVIVSQLVRSPSAYFNREIDKNGRELFTSQIIPTRGTWLEFEADARDVLYVRIDRTRKVTLTTLLRAFGLSSDEDILALFKQLGEVGLGTDKNIGGGKFEIEVAQLSISEVNTANAIMLLSLFIPTEKELPRLNLPNSRYELLQRGGYIAGSQDVMFRHLRKKSVYMFNIGSVFSTTIPIRGRVIDLRPDWQDKQLHPVFRSGKPFVVPIKMIEI